MVCSAICVSDVDDGEMATVLYDRPFPAGTALNSVDHLELVNHPVGISLYRRGWFVLTVQDIEDR
jgi:hypothetical protein